MVREMKISGVTWIDEIPSKWNLVNVRQVFSFGKGLSITKGDLRDSGVAVISYGQIHSKENNGLTVRPELIRFVEDRYLDSNPESMVYLNDFVFANTSEDLEGCGNAVFVDTTDLLFAGYHTIILRNKKNYHNKYFAFLFQSEAWRKQIRERVTGVKLFSISQRILRSLTILIPPIDEQKRIANFLTVKCTSIDDAIEKTRASIEEYKKLKQAIITQAVTKGIRPGRLMKDIGVDWIGNIPIEWGMTKMKYVAEFQPDCDSSNLTEDSEISYLPMECIKNGYFINNTAKYSSVSSSLTAFNDGDIVIAKVTPCFENGNVAIMENLTSGFGLGSSELFVLRPHSILTEFLFYWLQHEGFMQRGCSTMTGTGGLKRVSSYFVKNCPIVVPDDVEQKEIVAYLNEKTKEISVLIEKKERYLSELVSLKKSLIFEYVTGKKEVPA